MQVVFYKATQRTLEPLYLPQLADGVGDEVPTCAPKAESITPLCVFVQYTPTCPADCNLLLMICPARIK